jgi:hypothetical protein
VLIIGVVWFDHAHLVRLSHTSRLGVSWSCINAEPATLLRKQTSFEA